MSNIDNSPTEGDNQERSLEFQDSVVIDATKEGLWSTISDPEILTECVPGAEEVTQVSERKYTCEITRGISHLTISLEGEVEFVELNEPDWVVASGSAYDPKTHSHFDVLAAMEMKEPDDGTVNLSYTAELSFTGGIASLSTRVFRPIVRRDVDTYFENVKTIVEDDNSTSTITD